MPFRPFQAILILVLIFRPDNAFACLACYRSTDWLMAEAQLVILGEVIATKDAPKTEHDVEWNRSTNQTATVRVLRVIKGVWAGGDLQIGAGPIESCCPDPQYYHFAVGDRLVFMLTESVIDGRTHLHWGGSALDQRDQDLVINGLDRCRAWQSTWLSNHPKEAAAAVEIDLSLARFCQTRRMTLARQLADRQALDATFPQMTDQIGDGAPWSAPDYSKLNPEQRAKLDAWLARRQEEEKAAAKDLAAIFSPVSPVVLHTLACQHWLTQSPQWREDLAAWEHIVDMALQERAIEMEDFRHQVLGDRLAAAGVLEEECHAYLAALPRDKRMLFPWFPIETPIFSDGIDSKKAGSAVATTMLMSLAEDWDRGRIYLSYAMNDEVLADLDPVRLEPVVHRLCGSLCQEARGMGFRLVEKLPGSRFVPLVGECLLDNHQYAWRYIERDKDPGLTMERYKALAAWIHAQNPWRRDVLWGVLASNACFRTELIGGAVAEVQAWEATAAGENKPKDWDYETRAATSARGYLKAAQVSREPGTAPERSAADWKHWFDDHPDPVKSGK